MSHGGEPVQGLLPEFNLQNPPLKEGINSPKLSFDIYMSVPVFTRAHTNNNENLNFKKDVSW